MLTFRRIQVSSTFYAKQSMDVCAILELKDLLNLLLLSLGGTQPLHPRTQTLTLPLSIFWQIPVES